MAKETREPRNSNIPKSSYLRPFDVTKLGSEEDPCFGTLYDLNAPECGVCGDIEACSIAMMHNSTRIRTQLETENKYKDLEEADMIRKKRVKEYIQKKRAEGWGDTKILIKLQRNFSLTQAAARNLL